MRVLEKCPNCGAKLDDQRLMLEDTVSVFQCGTIYNNDAGAMNTSFKCEMFKKLYDLSLLILVVVILMFLIVISK